MQESSLEKFEKTEKDDNIILDLEVNPTTIECWRVCIWEHGIIAMFRGKEAYNKMKAFKDTKFTDLTLKRIL